MWIVPRLKLLHTYPSHCCMLTATTICTGTYQLYCSSNNTVLYCCHHLRGDPPDLFLIQHNTVICCCHHLHKDLSNLLLIQQHCHLLLAPFARGFTRFIPRPTTLSLLSSPSAQGPTKFTVHPTRLSSAVANTSTGITIYKTDFIQEQYRLLSPQFTLGSTRISSSSHSTVASCDHALYSHRNEGPTRDFSSSTTLLSSSSDVQHCCQLWRLYSHRNSLHLFLNKQNSAVC